jgi:hypothetical protein
MEVAGELEPHHPPYHPKIEPNYLKIYNFLARTLHGDPPPKLSPIGKLIMKWCRVHTLYYPFKKCL